MPSEIHVARLLFAYAQLRAQALRNSRQSQLGASAVEWAIISAIVVAAAVLIGGAIKSVVEGKKDDMCSQDDINCG